MLVNILNETMIFELNLKRQNNNKKKKTKTKVECVEVLRCIHSYLKADSIRSYSSDI